MWKKIIKWFKQLFLHNKKVKSNQTFNDESYRYNSGESIY